MEKSAVRRRSESRREEERLIAMLNGRRVRRTINPLPGTVYVTVSEFKQLMAQKHEKEPPARTLDNVFSQTKEETRHSRIRKERRGEDNQPTEERLIPMLNGKRVRRKKNPDPGTVFVRRSEYLAIIRDDGTNSQLDKSFDSYSLRKKRSTKPLLPKTSISAKEQRIKIKTFAKEMSSEMVELFANEIIPEEIRNSMSSEELEFKKHELSGDLAETINSRLTWAFHQATLESQGRLDYF